MMDPDEVDASIEAAEVRPGRRYRRAASRDLGKLDPDAATAMVQRSAAAEREATVPEATVPAATATADVAKTAAPRVTRRTRGKADPKAPGATAQPSPETEAESDPEPDATEPDDGATAPARDDVPPTTGAAERAVMDALEAGLAEPEAAPGVVENERRLFRRRRHVEEGVHDHRLPQLTPDQAASVVQAGQDSDVARRVHRLSASPQGLASAEHVVLRRAAERAATEQTALRLEAEELSARAAEARREAEEAAREHAEAAAAALAARLEAEEAAARSSTERQLADESAAEAVRGRIEAEHSAHVHAARAESESAHRAVAEGQAARAAGELRAVEERARIAIEASVQQQEALTAAVADRSAAERSAAEQARARAEAEEALTRLTVDRTAVEAAVLRHAELARESLAARMKAEERALELASALEATRETLLAEIRARRSWWQRPRTDIMPKASPAKHDPLATSSSAAPQAAAHRPRAPQLATPADGDGTVSFRARPGSSLLNVALTVAALVAAVTIVALAIRGSLFGVTGLVAIAATVVLMVGVSRTRTPPASINIDRGVVRIAQGASIHTFDLTNANTQIEVVGRPGSRGWRLMFLRRGLPPYVIDARTVDPVAFTEAVRRWRPGL